jgi:hypothetical protein
MRSGHYNHQRHVRQQAQFFAQVEADRQARTRIVGSFDDLDFDHNTPLVFTAAPAVDEAEPEPTEREDDAWGIWDRER